MTSSGETHETRDPRSPLVLVAAGGTGGHVFPAEALAQELRARGCTLALVTDRRGHAYGGALASIDVHRISAGGIAGHGLGGRIKGAAKLAWGLIEAYRLIRRLRPAVVVGFGGYASLPPMAAAVAAGVPTAIHEQNAVLGRANRLLAPRVSRLATSFASVAAVPARAQVHCTGMPVRPTVQAVHASPFVPPQPDGPVHLLVLGGSQGAHVFSDVIPAALKHLPVPLRARLQVAQQVRPEDMADVQAAYAGSGIDVDLRPFFHDVPQRLALAHLVIARSGASTVAELTVAGRPAILVPYPHATDDHQTANAHAVAETGGAWLMPQDSFTGESLASRLESLLAVPASLEKAARCALAAGRFDATLRLADLVQSLMPAAFPLKAVPHPAPSPAAGPGHSQDSEVTP